MTHKLAILNLNLNEPKHDSQLEQSLQPENFIQQHDHDHELEQEQEQEHDDDDDDEEEEELEVTPVTIHGTKFISTNSTILSPCYSHPHA